MRFHRSIPITAATLTLAALAAAQAPALPPLDVPLTIWDIAGVERAQDVCSTGVPLPCGLLKEPEGVAVFDEAGRAVPAQFRVLERWRDAGEDHADLSIRWLLVTFLADVPAGGKAVYRLKPGRSPTPASPATAEDKGDAWQMGSLVFRKDFTAPFRLLLTPPEGPVISTEGQSIAWSVWENGPVRACLRAESPTDHTRFGFIAWIYAYAGQPRWDMTLVLKNTPNAMAGPFYFRDFTVEWAPAEIRDARDFILGGEWGKAVAGTLDAAGSARIYQDSDGTDAWSTFGKDGQSALVMDWTPDKSKIKAGTPQFRGYKVFAGEREIGAGNFAAGWAALNGSGRSAFAAVRDFYPQYPKATEVAPGRIALRLWPKYWKGYGGLHWLDDCTRKAHDVTFRLAPAGLTAEQAEAMGKAFDYPLVAHPPAEWGLAAGAYRQTPSASPPKVFAGSVIATQPGTGRNWVTFGGDITDRIRRRYHGADLDRFARSGDPAAAYYLHKVARHSSGMTPLWLDDYQYPRDVKKLTHAQYCGLARGAGTYRTNTWHYGFMSWNDAHFCAQEVFDAWRLFADPLALDAVRTIGAWCQAYVDFREGGGGLVAGTRADGLPFHNLCEAYRVLGDASMPESMRRFAELSWKQVDKARGNYGIMGSWEGGNDRVEKPFMMAQVLQGVRSYWEITGDERAADHFLGMADFILAEASLGPWGFNYVVFIDPTQNVARVTEARKKLDDDPKPENQKNTSYANLSWVMAWAHRYTGAPRFRESVDGLSQKAYPHVPWAYTGYYPERADAAPPDAVTDLAAEPVGGGRVKLTWTAPAGGPARYQVKWADQPVVERLKYPDEQETRANWWAANQVPGEPAPAAGRQEMIVEGVPAGTRYFAIRSYDAAGNRSALSNPVRVDVR